LVLAKQFMVEGAFVGIAPVLMEIVHVQLSHKGSEVTVLEIDGQNCVYEFRYIANHKGSSRSTPPDYLIIFRCLFKLWAIFYF
jgi:hypothetical protein